MTYVYDLILNFNNDLLDFYEWDKNDDIYHIKRISMIKIKSQVYNEIIDNEVCFSKDILNEIFNKCEYFDQKKIKNLPYALLVTDSYRVMALLLNCEGKVIKYSNLLLDEEEDTLELSIRIPQIKLEYNIVKEKEKNNLTRMENDILKYIRKELNNCYKKKDYSKLEYLYYEYFNKKTNDINEIYKRLLQELDSEITNKHYNLYDLIKLSYSNKMR